MTFDLLAASSIADNAQAMKWLAVPWVLECAYRACFPSLYLQRYAFWDTPLNSIIVDRTWACVGELSWSFQVAYALRQIDTDLTRGTGWVQVLAWLSFVIYVAAECCSYYNTATTNELWAAIEVIVDAFSFVALAPAVWYLTYKSIAAPGKVWESSGKIYLVSMSVLCVVYPYFNFCKDAPMYLARYRQDEKDHKRYFSFLPGLIDAAERRVPTQNYADWQADMSWMTVYFTLGAWQGIALMCGPRCLQKRLEDDGGHEEEGAVERLGEFTRLQEGNVYKLVV